MRWHALRVPTQQEAVASRLLTECGFTTFYPIEHVTRRKHRRSVTRVVHATPLMPGYLFIGFNDDESPPWGVLAGFDLVTGVVGIRGQPLTFDERDMLWVATSSQRPTRYLNTGRSKSRFRAGVQAQIVSGPYEGRTVRVVEAEGRVREIYELVKAKPVS